MLTNDKICLLIGAGASTFSGKDTIDPSMPPLGKDLFEELKFYSDYYAELPEETKAEFENSKSFEQGMLKLLENGNPHTDCLIDLAKYFLQFTIKSENNCYYKLFDLFADVKIKPTVISLNYDMVAEEAIFKNGKYEGVLYLKSYQSIEEIDGNNMIVPVLKLHGSSNFLPISLGRSRKALAKQGIIAEDFNIYNRLRAIEVLNRNNALITPILSFYAPGKAFYVSIKNFDLKKQFNEIYRDVISKSNCIIIIGVFINNDDNHIWEPLLSKDIQMCIVNPQIDEYKDKFGNKIILQIKSFEDCFEEKRVDFIKFICNSR